MDNYLTLAPIDALKVITGSSQPRKATNEDYWRARLAGGKITAPGKPSVGQKLEEGIAAALKKSGVQPRYANHLASRAFSAFNDLTPVGNVIGADEGARMVSQGLTRGDLATAALGAAMFGLSAAPVPGAVRKGAGSAGKQFVNMLNDTEGAIRAWHGSPHDFDRFDMSKIGTGEGAQSFGHGLYFAENPAVAKTYQQRLSRGADGRLYEVNLAPNPEDFLHRDLTLAQQSPTVQRAIDEVPPNAWDWMAEEMENYGMNPIEPGDSAYKGHHLIRALEKYASEGEIASHIPWDDPRQHVSEFFRQQGLPGFSFLDQASRKAGAGTSNYVVFDDSLIDILNKF